jgi:hypothetical protein
MSHWALLGPRVHANALGVSHVSLLILLRNVAFALSIRAPATAVKNSTSLETEAGEQSLIP